MLKRIRSTTLVRTLVRHLATSSTERPQHVGILAMEAYFPKRFVRQEALEEFDGIPSGKYRIGLGQERMAFVGDREDINSIALSAVQGLMEKYNIKPEQIGRIEIGTETLVDKSKSTKTTLMDLMGTNSDMEGASILNACYGGTAALFNSVAWVESSAWDGRYAVIVAADIAVYEKGPARPTGGCGAIAMLIGPDAPLPLTPVRHTHAENCYDFYKPDASTEYPMVDGHMSNEAYLRSLDKCYLGFLGRAGDHKNVESFDHLLFHSPYNKLVQKSVGRLLYNDFVQDPESCNPTLREALQEWHPDMVQPEQTYADRGLDKALKGVSGQVYNDKSSQGSGLSQQIGNCYAAALYVNLLSLVCTEAQHLANKTVFMYSYGSGLIATAFSIQPRNTTSGVFSISNISKAVNLEARLSAREEQSPEQFTETLALREVAHGKLSYTPTDSVDTVAEGAYYLKEVTDPKSHRVYERR